MSTTEYVLGIDLGTSYFKLALFDRAGMLCGLARLPLPKQESSPGRCELAISDFWCLLRQGVLQALHAAAASPPQIRAVGYSSQANSFLLLDGTDAALTPLLLWPDQRAMPVDPRVECLWDREDFLDTTGMDLHSPEFMIAKLCWFQREAPASWARTRRVMTISDYLVHGLTGTAAGDAGTASLLGLWDLRRGEWWQEALDLLEIPVEFLSTPLAPGSAFGGLSEGGAAHLGLVAGTPLIAGGLDHHMAALGAGLGTLAEAVDSTGTVLALLRETAEYKPVTGCCMGPGAHGIGYYQLAFSGEGAAALEAYQREHAPDHTLESLLSEAGGEHGHRVRALLESSAHSLLSLCEKLYAGAVPARIVATGGGARSDLWLQIKADLLGAEFIVTACPEPACLGAALLAARGIGWFEDLKTASAAWIRVSKTIQARG